MMPRLLSYIAARRTSSTGTSVAAAIASIITPASAPWRSSPASRRWRNSCSSGVARPNKVVNAAARRAVEPPPRIPASSSSRRSTSRRCSAGSAAASVMHERKAAAPMPMRFWRNSPERYCTAISSSSALELRRQSPRSRFFAEREEVAATARDVATTSASNVTSCTRACAAHSHRMAETSVSGSEGRLSTSFFRGLVPVLVRTVLHLVAIEVGRAVRPPHRAALAEPDLRGIDGFARHGNRRGITRAHCHLHLAARVHELAHERFAFLRGEIGIGAAPEAAADDEIAAVGGDSFFHCWLYEDMAGAPPGMLPRVVSGRIGSPK